MCHACKHLAYVHWGWRTVIPEEVKGGREKASETQAGIVYSYTQKYRFDIVDFS